MAKIVSLDIGGKRTGMAETDAMQMMAFPLKTVLTEHLLEELTNYITSELPEVIVIGDPDGIEGMSTDSSELVSAWVSKIKIKWPLINVVKVDETYSSQLASRMLYEGGMRKSKRREKGAVDKVAASIILERYLDQR